MTAQEFGELKQPEIIGWIGIGDDVRPVYAVPGFLLDAERESREERREHIVSLLETRWFMTVGWRQRRRLRKAMDRVEARA